MYVAVKHTKFSLYAFTDTSHSSEEKRRKSHTKYVELDDKPHGQHPETNTSKTVRVLHVW